MKKFKELTELDITPYISENQWIEFALSYNPLLEIEGLALHQCEKEFFGLLRAGDVYHIFTKSDVIYVGLTRKQAFDAFDAYLLKHAVKQSVPEYEPQYD